jgi:hypothetical protein
MSASKFPSETRPLLADWVREFASCPPATGVYAPALRVTVAIVTPLAIAIALGRLEWAAYGVFAGIASVYGKRGDLATRLVAQLGAGALLIGATWLGIAISVVGPSDIAISIALGVLSLTGYLVSARWGWRPAPSLFLVFATGTIAGQSHTWHDLVESLAVGAASVTFAVLINAIGFLRRASPRLPSVRAASESPRLTQRNVAQTALLYAAAPSLAFCAAVYLDLGHPFWASVASVVPLATDSLGVRFGRATARLLGTLLGVGVAWVFFLVGAPIWVNVGLIAILQFHTEVFVGRNYGIAVIGLTPVPLLLIQILAPTAHASILNDRILETLLGLSVSSVILILEEVAMRLRSGAPA